MCRRKSDRTRGPRIRCLAGLVLLACTLAPVAVASAQVPASYSERVLSRPELISYWRLGETSTTTATDLKSGRNGTYTGGVTLGLAGALSADPDKAARFDGIDDSVTLPALSSHASFTIEGWQMLTSGAGTNNTLYGNIGGARAMPRPSGYYADVLAGSRYLLQGTTATNIGVWVHWALVRSGPILELFRNGVSVARRTDLPAMAPTDLSGQIGRLGLSYPAKATIDDVAVYSRALTAAEISDDYASRMIAPGSLPPPPPPGPPPPGPPPPPPGPPPPAPPPPPSGPFYVDGNSVGGTCSDARTAAQAASATTPWCSIAVAASAAPDGSDVLVRAGTYPSVAVAGVINSAYVRFKPFGAEKPVLDGLRITNSTFLRFERFRITESTYLDQASDIQLVGNDVSPQEISIIVASNLLIEDNTIHDLTMDIDPATSHCRPPRCGYGVRIQRGTNVTIRNNRFQRIPADGIQSGTATNYLIEGNTFEDITAFVDPAEHCDSIQFYRGSDGATIRANTFRRTRGPLLGSTEAAAPQRDLVIENNLLISQTDWGLQIYNAPRLKLVNNTVWDARLGVVLRDATQIAEKTTAAVAINNIFEFFDAQAGMFSREDYNLVGTGLRGGAHDLSGPPRFVDPVALDYRLAGGSPGIDAGTSDGAPTRDLTDAARVDTPAIANTGGGAQPYYELGALEFTAAYNPPGGSYASRILGLPSLLSYWRLGESSGTVAKDEKGGRDGTYQNGVALRSAGALSGDPNTAVSLDGIDDHITLPALPQSVDFTIEGWQRLSAASSANQGLYGTAGTLRLIGRASGFYTGIYLGPGNTEYITQVTTASNLGQWVYWAVTRDGATLDVYRNGIRVGGRTDLPATAPANLSGVIGRIGPNYPMKGAIDEVAVYSSALDVAEIRAHRDIGVPPA